MTGWTTEERLDRMEAIHAIRQLPYRYAFGVDSRDIDGFMSIWDDAVEPSPPPFLDHHTFAGNPDRFFRTSVASIHFIGNHLVELTGPDTATGRVYCLCHTDRHGFLVRQWLLYNDEYVRRDGEWRFARREHLLWWGEHVDPNPREQPPMDWPDGDLRGSGSIGRGTLPEGFATYQAFWAGG